MTTRAPVPKSHEANLRKFGLCMRIPPKKLGFRTAGMAAALGVILFAYIYLVFLVTHRICMMQCNPMSRPGKWHQNGRNVSVLLFGSPRSSRRPVVATEQLYKFLASLYLKFVV